MVLFFRAITRAFVLLFAYFLSVTAAMATLAAGVSAWQMANGFLDASTPEEEAFFVLFFSFTGVVSYFYLLYTALVPAAVFALVTEAFSWRSLVVHVLGGGAIAAYILIIKLDPTGTPPQDEVIITLASGFVGGFVYWLIAGRKAGSWR